jgi:hypothetical protein
MPMGRAGHGMRVAPSAPDAAVSTTETTAIEVKQLGGRTTCQWPVRAFAAYALKT